MRKRIIALLLVSLLLCPAPAQAFVMIDPIVNNPDSDMYVPEFNNNETTFLQDVRAEFNKKVQQLNQLEQKYPGQGFGKYATELQNKFQTYDKASVSKGMSFWGDTPAYMSTGNSLCVTDHFFSSTYTTEDRVAVLLHELVHLDQYRSTRYGSNVVNFFTFGFVAKPSETNSNIEEYKWLRIMGRNNSFEMNNCLLALVEQGVIQNTKDTDNLDSQLGIQAIAKIAGQGLDAALQGQNTGIVNKPAGLNEVQLIPGQTISSNGSITGFSMPIETNTVPKSVQGGAKFDIAGPGTLYIKAGFASSQDNGPRFNGDELGYRSQAYMVIVASGGKESHSFSNGYNHDYSYINVEKSFTGADSVSLVVVPQGCTADISSVTGELVEMSDGTGYMYYGGQFQLEMTFKPEESQNPPSNNSGDIKVMINNQPLITDTPPMIIDGRTMVPVAAIFRALDAQVSWDPTTRTVTGTKNGKVIKLQIDNNTAWIDGQPVQLDVPATIVNNRTMVPAAFISMSLGMNVNWDPNTSTVSITN